MISGSFWKGTASALNICAKDPEYDMVKIKPTHGSQQVVCANQTPVDFILQTLYLDVVPESLDYTVATLFADAQYVC